MERFEDLGRKIFQAPKDEPEELEEETNGELERDPSGGEIVTPEEREAVRSMRLSAKSELESLETLTDEQIEAISAPEQEITKAAAFVEYTKELRIRYPEDAEVAGARGAAGLIIGKAKIVLGLLK
jgi:hypothetical protein